MRRFHQISAALLVLFIFATGVRMAPQTCEAGGSVCPMGCVSQTDSCCCNIDQQKSPEPAKVVFKTAPFSPRCSNFVTGSMIQSAPVSGVLFRVSSAGETLPALRGGLAFLGIFLI
jgi:hypothetical protein